MIADLAIKSLRNILSELSSISKFYFVVHMLIIMLIILIATVIRKSVETRASSYRNGKNRKALIGELCCHTKGRDCATFMFVFVQVGIVPER